MQDIIKEYGPALISIVAIIAIVAVVQAIIGGADNSGYLFKTFSTFLDSFFTKYAVL